MRITTSGSFPRFDISLFLAAIEPLRAEWAALRFDASGAVVNPISGEALEEFRLVEGRHRSPGARYEIVTRTPALVAGTSPYTPSGVADPALAAPTGEVTETTNRFTLRSDDARALALTVADPQELWSADVDIVHGRIPRIDVTGRVDATAMMLAEDVPRFVARRIGGVGTGTATLDLAAVERAGSSTIAQVSGQLNRFRADGTATVRTTPRTWDVEGTFDLVGRGLGRLVLRVMRKRLQAAAESSLHDYWSSVPAATENLQREVDQMTELVRQEGGVGEVLHRVLWEEGYAERLETTYFVE